MHLSNKEICIFPDLEETSVFHESLSRLTRSNPLLRAELPPKGSLRYLFHAHVEPRKSLIDGDERHNRGGQDGGNTRILPGANTRRRVLRTGGHYRYTAAY